MMLDNPSAAGDQYAVIYRAVHTVALERLRAWAAGRRLAILELGAAPYVFSGALLNALDCELACVSAPPGIWPGEMPPPYQTHVKVRSAGKERDIPLTLLNVERDPLPYGDGSFDVVLCMDVIPYLGYHPTLMFYEARRVLRPGGLLLLTLPNGLSLRRLFWLLAGIVDADRFAARGIYARRQRSTAPQEIEALVGGCGFRIERIEFLNLAPLPPAGLARVAAVWARALTHFGLPALYTRRDYILLTASASDPPHACYPAGIYHQARLYPPIPTPPRQQNTL